MSVSVETSHPTLTALAQAQSSLTAAAEPSPVFMRPAEQGTTLRQLAALEAQILELKARVTVAAGAAGGIADVSGARDIGAWLSAQTRVSQPAARAQVALAKSLERRAEVATALRSGALSPEQAQVIVTGLERLPFDVPPQIVDQAELHLVGEAATFGPRALRHLARRVLDVVAPDIAEAHEARALADEERSAWTKTRLSVRPQGDGTTLINGLLPDLAATRLANLLHAFTSPRRATTPDWSPRSIDSGDQTIWWRLPHSRKLGHALCELLEHIDPGQLPDHGAESTHLIVTVTLEALRSELGAATVAGPDGEERISAGQARRLACNAGIIPAVLGAESHVLDLGRTRRLATKHQRRALMLTQPTCRAEGCERPAAWCEAHHLKPWQSGGRTDLNDLVLLCAHDHRRIHDTSYLHQRLPDGTIRFTRRI